MEKWNAITEYESERTNSAISLHEVKLARGLITVTKLASVAFQIYQ